MNPETAAVRAINKQFASPQYFHYIFIFNTHIDLQLNQLVHVLLLILSWIEFHTVDSEYRVGGCCTRQLSSYYSTTL